MPRKKPGVAMGRVEGSKVTCDHVAVSSWAASGIIIRVLEGFSHGETLGCCECVQFAINVTTIHRTVEALALSFISRTRDARVRVGKIPERAVRIDNSVIRAVAAVSGGIW